MADDTIPDIGPSGTGSLAGIAGYDPRWILWDHTKRVQTYEHTHPDGWVRLVLWSGGTSPAGQMWTRFESSGGPSEYATRTYGIYMKKGEVLRIRLGGRAVWPNGDRGTLADWEAGRLIQGGYPDGGNGAPKNVTLRMADGTEPFGTDLSPPDQEATLGIPAVWEPWETMPCNGAGGSTTVELAGSGKVIIEPGDGALRDGAQGYGTDEFLVIRWSEAVSDFDNNRRLMAAADRAPTYWSATFNPTPPVAVGTHRRGREITSWADPTGLVQRIDLPPWPYDNPFDRWFEMYRYRNQVRVDGAEWRGADAVINGLVPTTSAGGGGYGGGGGGGAAFEWYRYKGWFPALPYPRWVTPDTPIAGRIGYLAGRSGGRWYSTVQVSTPTGDVPIVVYDPDSVSPTAGLGGDPDKAWPNLVNVNTTVSVPWPYLDPDDISRVGFGAAWICPLDVDDQAEPGVVLGRITAGHLAGITTSLLPGM